MADKVKPKPKSKASRSKSPPGVPDTVTTPSTVTFASDPTKGTKTKMTIACHTMNRHDRGFGRLGLRVPGDPGQIEVTGWQLKKLRGRDSVVIGESVDSLWRGIEQRAERLRLSKVKNDAARNQRQDRWKEAVEPVTRRRPKRDIDGKGTRTRSRATTVDKRAPTE